MSIIIGIILGLLYVYKVYPKKEGEKPSIKLTIEPFMKDGIVRLKLPNNKIFHIHHWMMIVFTIIFFCKKIHISILSFMIVLFIHGLSYDDAFSVIEYGI